MELLLRTIQFLMKILYNVVYVFLVCLLPRRRKQYLPPITDEIMAMPVTDLIHLMRIGRITSRLLVETYINRIKEVNPYINAIVEERFEEALKEAENYDKMRDAYPQLYSQNLFNRYPLFGIPFTVKESCGVKGMSHVVGSLKRVGMKAEITCEPVERLIAAGGILLLVSATPEYCYSIETNTLTMGRCLNPYDYRRTCGGSSGGEGALQGCGASPFGIGSDIAGSIRIPCLFNGVFGHKPTGGVIPTYGHFPNSNDPKFAEYLQMGPMTRFGRDLNLLMQLLVGQNDTKLNLCKVVNTKDIKIYYSFGFGGLNGFLHHGVAFEIKNSILEAVSYFKGNGLFTQRANIKHFHNSTEIALSSLVRLQDFPYLMSNDSEPPVSFKANLKELWTSICGRSQYTKEGLNFELMRTSNAFIRATNFQKYEEETRKLRQEIIDLLGTNGVLFFPTFVVPAIHHNSAVFPLWAIDYCLIFNVLGLPCTHIPMGLTAFGLPIGFQIIAAPYQDRLCLHLAEELDYAFGGWSAPPNSYS